MRMPIKTKFLWLLECLQNCRGFYKKIARPPVTFSIDIYLAEFLKTNLTKFAVIGSEKASKGRFLGLVQLQITLG